ncbi:uncharacterized protein LOC144202704 isoform X2 [Stigmatopora nigra]
MYSCALTCFSEFHQRGPSLLKKIHKNPPRGPGFCLCTDRPRRTQSLKFFKIKVFHQGVEKIRFFTMLEHQREPVYEVFQNKRFPAGD